MTGKISVKNGKIFIITRRTREMKALVINSIFLRRGKNDSGFIHLKRRQLKRLVEKNEIQEKVISYNGHHIIKNEELLFEDAIIIVR